MTISSPLTRTERIDALTALGRDLQEHDARLLAHIHRAEAQNPWFTADDIIHAVDTIARQFLQRDDLVTWSAEVSERSSKVATVGIIMAGNIPMVGFHDLLCTFVAGHRARIKLSDKDKVLIPYVLKRLAEIDPRAAGYFEVVDKLKGFDAVIATGSNNTARFFDYYFGKYPNIIRRNRNAVAVLTGEESAEQLHLLGEDVFRYFGLGCRSVAHLCVPEGYDFGRLQEAFAEYADRGQHRQYRNNLDYNLAIYILSKEPHIAMPHVILLQNERLISPVGCLYYSHYGDLQDIAARLSGMQEEIQVVVAAMPLGELSIVPFGTAQKPALDDYADGVDTLEFLLHLETPAQ